MVIGLDHQASLYLGFQGSLIGIRFQAILSDFFHMVDTTELPCPGQPGYHALDSDHS